MAFGPDQGLAQKHGYNERVLDLKREGPAWIAILRKKRDRRMIKHSIVWPFSLMLLGLGGEAFAQTSTAAPEEAWPSPSPTAPQPRPAAWGPPAPDASTRQWYGGQVLIGYGASDLLVAAGVISIIRNGGLHGGDPRPSFLLLGTGLAVQVFAAPIIHWSHGHVGRGFLSLGLNGGLPVGVASLGSLSDGSGPTAFIGFFAAMLVGRAIDVAVLSYDEVEESSAASGRRGAWAPALTLAPVVGRDQTGLGVAGVF